MQMRVHVSTIGLGIPRTKIGATVSSVALIEIRAAEKHKSLILSVGDYLTLGGPNNTIAASSVKTKWFNVDSTTHSWIKDCDIYSGNKLKIVCKGTIGGDSYIDLVITAHNKDGITTPLIKRENLEASGYQIAETTVFGEVKNQSHVECKIPA
ncbi:MAG: hypothetical protein ACRBBR_05980 [Cellvibrionaceae bacterium]